VVGLITDNDETAYREEVRDLAVWCQDNKLSINVIKTKELSVDHINRAIAERGESFKFLGLHITNYQLSWSKHTKKVMKRTQQHLFPLRRLKIFGMGP
jgi:EAL domain-containing protein (putative c-di-GMP-specific phosphodiesterase class I)